MAKDFILPDLGEGIHEAQVVNVMIKEGDTVTEDQMVMEVETDKASVELPVPFAGVVSSLNVSTGDTVTVGQVLLSVDGEGGESDAAPAQAAEPAKQQPAARQQASSAEGNGEDTPHEAQTAVAAPPQHGPGPVPAAPAVRRLARELGIDLRSVRGTGPGGRVVREDVERFQIAGPSGTGAPPQKPAKTAEPARPAQKPAAAAQAPAPRSSAPSMPAAPEQLPDFSQWGKVRRETVPQIRKTIAKQMARSWSIIPHVSHADEVDITDLEKFRKEHGAIFAEQGAKLTLTAFVIKGIAGALQQYPASNASFDEASMEIIYKDYVNIGIAVDTPRGLMVPVIRDVDRKSLMVISKELIDIADRAREFKLDINEMRGGTFTLTNVGALGGTLATPMINWPEVAILGMGKMSVKPVYRNDELVPRKILPLFMSFDHRVIDGADGARFMKAVITFLENPLNLLLVS